MAALRRTVIVLSAILLALLVIIVVLGVLALHSLQTASDQTAAGDVGFTLILIAQMLIDWPIAILALITITLAAFRALRTRDWFSLATLLIGVVSLALLLIFRDVFGLAEQFLFLPLSALLVTPLLALLYVTLEKRRQAQRIATGVLAALAVLLRYPVPVLLLLLQFFPIPGVLLAPSAPASQPSPAGDPKLTVQAILPPNVDFDCALGQYPQVSLQNSGTGTLHWQFGFAALEYITPTQGHEAVTLPGVTSAPSGGTLAAGKTQVITLSGAYTPPPNRGQSILVNVHSDANEAEVTVPCNGHG